MLDYILTISGMPRFLHEREPLPARAVSKRILHPFLELLALVRNPRPIRIGDWITCKDNDKLDKRYQKGRRPPSRLESAHASHTCGEPKIQYC
jgi:hypothetical protein